MVSCVVLNYNNYKMTIEFIESVKDIEIIDKVIVIDNDSTNDSFVILQKCKNERVEVVSSGFNGGYAAGNNYGLKRAFDVLNSDYAIVANPDVVFTRAFVENALNAFETYDSIGLISGVALDCDNAISYESFWELPGFRDCCLKFSKINNLIKTRKFIKETSAADCDIKFTGAVSGALFMISKEAFKSCGGFDEKTFLYCEESILGARLKKAGYKVAVMLKQYYIHNHQYHKESPGHRIKHYKILLDSRLYYLKEYVRIGKTKEYLFIVAAKLSILLRSLKWKSLGGF